VKQLARANKKLKDQYRDIEASHKLIRSLLEGVPNPIIFYSVEGIILDCNRLFAEFTGKSASTLCGKLVYLQFEGDIDTLHLQTDRQIIAGRHGTTYSSNLGRDNQEFLISKNVAIGPDGEVNGIICVITDVTDMRRAHDESMEVRRKELVSSSLHLIQLAELNNNLISELAKVNLHVTRKGSMMINQIINSYKISSRENVWNDFEVHFNRVYEKFYLRLQQRFPDLTPGERKLCALLRLNLSSKDIAAITFQNPNSIDVARYRLRKKLNLGLAENLVDFLSDIER
jgi:PAS domain S-box-containing protein